MTAIQELEFLIRDVITAPRRQTVLLADASAWAMLCSSLDVLGDTELAIEAYLKSEPGLRSENKRQQAENKPDPGINYLALYGILQVLFAQQDAVQHLAEALRIDYEHEPVLKDVRENRNNAVGHPTKRGSGKAFNSILRMTLTWANCDLFTTFADGTSEFKSIHIPTMIEVQREAISRALTGILTKLREDETSHRRQFRGTKLADAFSTSLDYWHEEIGDSINGNMPSSIGEGRLQDIERCIAKLKGGLSSRGPLDAYSHITEDLGQLDYSIAELFTFFSQPDRSKLNKQDAMILHFFIYKKLESIKSMAEELDRDYARDV